MTEKTLGQIAYDKYKHGISPICWKNLPSYHKKAFETIAQAVIAEHEARKWQPIETAPRDGAPVALYRPTNEIGTHDQRVTAIYHSDWGWVWPDQPRHDGWWDDLGRLINSDDFFYSTDDFTHWQPLSAPPNQGSKS